jgi:hypothetical protein
MLQVHAGAGE